MSNFRDVDRQTAFLLPPSVDEWLPGRHLARFIVEVIEKLDLRAMSGSYRGSGSASYHPSMLLGLLVYSGIFNTVKINASFYLWPTVAGVKVWQRQPGGKDTVYTVKVCELITHIKKFTGTKTLIRDFGMIADVLGEQMGCFLFQLPPSFRYTMARLNSNKFPAPARFESSRSDWA